jgi:integrase
MRGFLTWLAGSERGGAALVEPGVRDRAVRDYKRHVQTARHWAPSTVNQALAAIDSFYRSIGVGRPEVAREELARVAPRALAKVDQRRFLRAVEGCLSARDRAIATVFFYTGLRLSELAALEVGDLSVSARRGRLRVRSGKGDADPGSAPQQRCRHAIDEWTTARTDQVAAGAATSSPPAASAALWLSRSESRMSARVIDLIIRRLAKDAHLELSAHTLLEGPSMTAVGTSHRARRGRPAAAEVRPAGLRHLLAVVVAGARCGRGGRLGPGGRPPRLARRPRLAWWCGRRGARCAAGCGRCCVGRWPPAPGRCSSRGHAREVRELVPTDEQLDTALAATFTATAALDAGTAAAGGARLIGPSAPPAEHGPSGSPSQASLERAASTEPGHFNS